MEISLCNKILYCCDSLYDEMYKILFPYKNTFVFDNDNKYKDNAYVLNSKVHIFFERLFNINFNEIKRVLVNYAGNKIFNVAIYASSHYEVKKKIKEIVINYKNIHPKIRTNLPNFIEKVCFIDNYNNEIIDVKERIDESINYDDNIISFFDISLLVNIDANSIKSIRVIYNEDFEKMTKEFDFIEHKNRDISFLNSIYETYY